MRLVIRNRYVLGVAVLGTFGGLGIYWMGTPLPWAWAGLVILSYSVWLLFLEWRGIIIHKQMLSFPNRPLPWLPIFALARVRLPLEGIEDIKYAGAWMGMEHVLLSHQSDRQQLLFHTRAARRLFFTSVKLNVPKIQIYRVYKR